MCWTMAVGHQEENMPRRRLRRQLAAAVHSIQWSYAILWSASSRQPGMLEWNDGYYNGDIKTRKTTQPMELKADQMALQRSEQLRQLYMSLSAGDGEQLARRPSALLSPEDLSDSEWYYLVCMSFTFHAGHGLVGRTLACGNHIWLFDAPSAESKIFTRSLLAKVTLTVTSCFLFIMLQTVFCCPFMDGVLELGTTETVLEDPDLIKKVTTSFWDYPKTLSSGQSLSSNLKVEEDEDQMAPPPSRDHDMLNPAPSENLHAGADRHTQSGDGVAGFAPTYHTHSSMKIVGVDEDRTEKLQADSSDELKTGSPDYCSNDCCANQHTDEFTMMQGPDGKSQARSWQFMDDELSNGLHGSLNSSDDKCQSFSDLQVVSSPKEERIEYVNGLQICHNMKLTPLDPGADNAHYTRTLSAIFRNPAQADVMPFLPNGSHASSFEAWRKGSETADTHVCVQQKLLKKILFNVALMHGGKTPSAPERNEAKSKTWKPEGDAVGLSHQLSERKRREKMNKKFLILKSLLPSISKIDKASILGDTIDYLKELERRVGYLESYMGDLEAKGGKKHPDVAERTSDNYGRDEIACGKKSPLSKRKACDVDEQGFENHWILSKDGMADINVTIMGKEVLLQLSCPWRDSLLLEIVDAISNLHLDALSVQSSTVDGNLTLTIKSKFRGSVIASPGMIKCTLQRVISKC
ncbi:hypothetical protein Taro_040612 [Colocasia esculenta]|uniref:BHLH domain-containing protein n=1 Tax=Colocasia esculenta TaxID=4460 RepID=A0A843WQY1_COLES|nr:hypothetical protein [Colocasia esculenta]